MKGLTTLKAEIIIIYLFILSLLVFVVSLSFDEYREYKIKRSSTISSITAPKTTDRLTPQKTLSEEDRKKAEKLLQVFPESLSGFTKKMSKVASGEYIAVESIYVPDSEELSFVTPSNAYINFRYDPRASSITDYQNDYPSVFKTEEFDNISATIVLSQEKDAVAIYSFLDSKYVILVDMRYIAGKRSDAAERLLNPAIELFKSWVNHYKSSGVRNLKW